MKDVYTTYGVKKVINASGKMTILGGSKVSQEVCDAMTKGASNFYEIKDLLEKTGEYLAKKLGVESAYIVNSASGGIAQSVAACICEEPLDVYQYINKKREVIICKGHNVDYGTAIELTITLGGGKVVEAGYANACTIEHVASKMTENTVALLFVKSHHCVQKGMPSIPDFITLARKYHLPVIVDAAAEEDLIKYYSYGADVVIYSGTKAIEGPTSGLLLGKKEFIDKVKQQSTGIGRVMKVGKENILGLTEAINRYLDKDKLSLEEQQQRFEKFNTTLNSFEGVLARSVQDSAGRSIIRSEITFDETLLDIDAKEVSKQLKSGEIRIYTRDYRANVGTLEIDSRDVSDQELIMIQDKIIKIIRGEKYE